MKTSDDKKTNPWPFRLWISAIVLLALILSVLVSAWAVRHVLVKGGTRFTDEQAELVMGIASFPGQVKIATQQIVGMLNDEPTRLLINKADTEKPYWTRSFPYADDDGYLLFSGVNPGAKQASISLIRISDGKVLANWVPDWDEVLSKTNENKYSNITKTNILPIHPLLLPDGDVIFNTWETMVRLSPCHATPKWVLGDVAHHSNHLDEQGNIWAPSIATGAFEDNPWLGDQIRDDALALVSPDGKILQKISFSKIMRDNGLEALLFGTKGLRIHDDPIHMNEIAIAPSTTEHWQKGDLLISARNMSTVFLYRPSTGRVIWYQTGPWMNQHSATFLNDHQIYVFDNNAIVEQGINSFVTPGSINRVLVYDFNTKQVSEPYAKLLAETKPISVVQGRAQILKDGGLFLEETTQGRHLRFSKDKLLWSRVNDYDEERIGMIAWSRYLTPEEVAEPLKAISKINCNEPK